MDTACKSLGKRSAVFVAASLMFSLSTPLAESAQRYFVRVVTDGRSVTFEGEPTTWDKLPTSLAKVSHRPETVLELAIASDQVSVGEMTSLQQRGMLLAVEHEFEHASYIGIQPLDSKGSPSEYRSRSRSAGPTGMTRSQSVYEANGLAFSSRNLTPDRAAELEARLARQAFDIEARTRLIGCYYSQSYVNPGFRKAYVAHLLWLIENEPLAPILATSYSRIDRINHRTAHQRGRDLFLGHLKKDPKNVDLLDSLAEYLTHADGRFAEELLERAIKLDPENPDRHQKLAFQTSLRAKSIGSGKAAAVAWNKSLNAYERAYELGSDRLKRNILTYLSQAALAAGEARKARRYANESLKHGGRSGEYIFHGHTVLGELALDEGDVAAARKHLIASAKNSGSPSLGSFGPTMRLAKRMITVGEKDAAIEFFRLCKFFWQSPKLDEWTEAVKQDRMPDFGSNMR